MIEFLCQICVFMHQMKMSHFFFVSEREVAMSRELLWFLRHFIWTVYHAKSFGA